MPSMNTMSSGNDGSLVSCDEIDWTTIDYAALNEIVDYEKCDIQDFLEPMDLIDAFWPDLEYQNDGAWNERLLSTSVGQPTCEKKDKALLECTSFEAPSCGFYNEVCVNEHPIKKKKKMAFGPSNRACKKRTKGLPKRPLSAYNLFFQSERLKIFEEGIMSHERISFQGLAKLVGQRWQVLDEEKRRELRLRSQEDIVRYQNEMKEYREKHGHDPSFVVPRKKSPPNSPKSSKSILKLPGSPKQKSRSGERSLNGLLKSQKEENAATNKTNSEIKLRCPSMEELPSSIHSKLEQSDHGNCRLLSFPPSLVPVMSDPLPLPLRDHSSAVSGPRMADVPITQTENDCRAFENYTGHAPINSTPPDINFTEVHPNARLWCRPSTCVKRYPQLLREPMRYSNTPVVTYVNTLPIGKELKLYDPCLGIRRPFKIEYKCYAMKRSDAKAYILRHSYPGINGSCYVPLEHMLRAPPPPGIEVKFPRSKPC